MKRNSAYLKYKPSGVEWLGDVPEHWETVSLKWASVRYSGGTPDKTIQDYWEGGTIPWLNSGAVNDGYITEPSEYITDEAFRNSSAKWIPRNSLVIALAGQGKTKGMVAQVGFKTTCNQSMAAIIPDKRFDARFLFWWITKIYSNLRNLAGGDARDGLNLEMIGSIPCPLPPFTEQQPIAAFLDRETGRIDTLVAKKERLIELLREKRSALISHAVTKGLDPLVKLQPSGVEWLGDVPEHWKVKRVKDALLIRKGAIKTGPFGSQLLSSEMMEGEVKVYNQRNVLDKDFVSGENYVSEEKFLELKEFQTYPGDILVTTRGTIGRCAVLPLDAEKGILHPCLMRLQINKDVLSERYLEILIQDSGIIITQLQIKSNSTTIEVIYQESLKNIILPLPPLREQQAIATFLDRETGKIDALIAKVEDAIAKLKEYRTTLISAAVTGKIDVREAA